MKSIAQARELAQVMVDLGSAHGLRTVAVVTDMSTPLGRAVGNAVEVAEAVEVLAGGGPPDVVELTLVLAREMLAAAGLAGAADPAAVLASGRAMDVWRAMVRAQGGDPDAALPTAAEVELVRAPRGGTVAAVDARGIGEAAWRLGAGRARKEHPVSAAAGVVLHRRPGDPVRAGEPLYELRTDDPTTLPAALAAARDAVTIGEGASPPPSPLVIDRVPPV